jgi:hypothetical protein
MNCRWRLSLSLLVAISASLHGQGIVHPWHVVDRGGGKATSGIVTMRSSIGQSSVAATASAATLLEEGYMPGLRELAGTLGELNVEVEESWNMLSVPLAVTDYRKTTLYPTATSVAFAYAGSYRQADTLQRGAGYWLKFSGNQLIDFSGATISRETVAVNNGWNMIGALSYPLAVSGVMPIPPTTIASNFFGYSNATGYATADTLTPGGAYWVKVGNTGALVMSADSAAAMPAAGVGAAERETDADAIVVRDAEGLERTLYVAASPDDRDMPGIDLPPAPPCFDARFATNRLVEAAAPGSVKTVGIQITSALYPVKISWRGGRAAALPLERPGEVEIRYPEAQVKLQLAPSSVRPVPTVFALHQNFPNPFNPVTTIRFEMPHAAVVTIAVYDLLGREVARLAGGLLQAGYHTAEWRADGVPSGIYFCRMNAGSFIAVRKMVVVR